VKISTREKRFLTVGSAIAVIGLAFYLVPMLLPEDLSATVEARKNMLLRQRELISQQEIFKTRIAQGQQRLDLDMSRLLPGDSPAAAGPALQKVLQDLADSLQVEVSRKTPMPEQKMPENLTKVTVQLDINCTLDQLVRLLAAIENYEKFLKVDELFIQGMRLRNRDEIRPMIKVAGYVATPVAAAKPGEKDAGAK
jgi:hypothetical protein